MPIHTLARHGLLVQPLMVQARFLQQINPFLTLENTIDVYFTNILQAAFLYKSVLCSFTVFTVCVCNFWQKEISTKAAHKMLVKLTKGVNFTNILQAAFVQKCSLQLFCIYSLCL